MSEYPAGKTRPTGIVTIDVEPDNVWAETNSQSLKNVRHLPIFHRLCQDYGVRPTYLVSWSVAKDDESTAILETLLRQGDCEVGMHPHLWETPPFGAQDFSGRACVGPDYTPAELASKLTSLANLLKTRFGTPLSHRAGRWGIDIRQVDILTKLGIKFDTSIIPGVNWSSTGILDHTKAPLNPYLMGSRDICLPDAGKLLQVPCTIKPGIRMLGLEKNRYAAAVIRRLGCGNKWLRVSPTVTPADLLKTCAWASNLFPHLNLMSHSAEFMAGGSPYWRTEADVASHLDAYRHIFAWWQRHGIVSKTLAEFGQNYLAAHPMS